MPLSPPPHNKEKVCQSPSLPLPTEGKGLPMPLSTSPQKEKVFQCPSLPPISRKRSTNALSSYQDKEKVYNNTPLPLPTQGKKSNNAPLSLAKQGKA